MDVKTTFLNGDLEKEIYMMQPKDYKVLGKRIKFINWNAFEWFEIGTKIVTWEIWSNINKWWIFICWSGWMCVCKVRI